MRYIPWLLYEIFLANLHILYLVFHPRMMELIDPKIIRFRSKLKKDFSLVTFANSITLTPGTITVYVSIDGNFHVHAIDKKSGDALPGEMEDRVAEMEARSQAVAEVYESDGVDQEFLDMEAQAAVDAELEALKREIDEGKA